MSAECVFYVYVHHRKDTGAPFYVGKGKGYRARVEQHRNPFWRAVAAKAGGYEVRKPVTGARILMKHAPASPLQNKVRGTISMECQYLKRENLSRLPRLLRGH
jgi:hypothetical protein